jgi:two-component system sensor histidine kinase/response regulator
LLLVIRRALGQAHEKSPVAAAAGQRAGQSLRILVAEDNAINQLLAVGLLEGMGHRATIAVNGLEAVSKWEQEEFDLILMDVQMPELDGFGATQRIRQAEAAKGTHARIIAMTAHAMAGDRERCLQAGMDDYVSKPVSRKSLEQVIANGTQSLAASGS